MQLALKGRRTFSGGWGVGGLLQKNYDGGVDEKHTLTYHVMTEL